MSWLFYILTFMAFLASLCQLLIGDWLMACGFLLAVLVNATLAHKAESEESYLVGD